MCIYREWLEAWKFGFKNERYCSFYVAKTKALISCAVTVQLICVFVFAYAKSHFSTNEAHIGSETILNNGQMFVGKYADPR